jgi:RNA cap guanine-N2 methyltransferase
MEPTPSSKLLHISVAPLPAWIDRARLLGPFAWRVRELPDGLEAEAQLSPREAAGLEARLRGLGLDGQSLRISIEPALPRALVRAARLDEARARRATTPGFSHKAARASDEGRYSLTPEALALALAAEARGRSVLDACCGSGGNAVAFARAGCAVTAVEIAPARLAEAQHNARVYEVAGRIEFVRGDALIEVARRSAEILFIDPPWGPAYDKRATARSDFPLLSGLLDRPDVLAAYAEIWLKLPSSFATRSVPGSAVRAWFGEAPGDRQRVKFVQLTLTRGGAQEGT